MQDTLGDWIKANLEAQTRRELPRRSLAAVRVDGRSFHRWTHGLERPYDLRLMRCMDAVGVALCEEISGASLGFVQSDEASVLFGDLGGEHSEHWFGG